MLTSASLISLLAVLAASDEIQDSQSLLQSTIYQHQTDACTCLDWKDVYAKHGVQCGMGHELDFAGGMLAADSTKQEFCVNFFEKITSNVCVNMNFGAFSLDQWCYVSTECPKRAAATGDGADLPGEKIGYKLCDANEDKTLGSMTPDEVHQWSKDENTDAGLVLKMAYPIFPPSQVNNVGPIVSVHWSDIKDALAGNQTTPSQKRATKALQKAKDFNQYSVIFDSPDGHPPFGVVYGSTIVESHFSDWGFKQLATGEDTSSALGKMNDYECLQGCK